MKLTKEDFHEVLKQTAAEIIDEALKEKNRKLAFDTALVGALFGAVLTKNLFHDTDEIEIITDKE